MAKQNAQQPEESAPSGPASDQADRIFGTASEPAPVADDPDTAPILRRRQPTVIPKLQGRNAARPVVYPALASLAAADPAPSPADPERTARRKMWLLSAAAGVAVVMIATGILLATGGHDQQSSAALPTIAVSADPALSTVAGAEALGSAPPADSLSGPTEAASRTSATRPAPPSAKPDPAPTGLANPAGVDLALHKPVTASGSEGAAWAPAEAVDGDLTTRWSSAFADPQWIRIDLGALRQIKRVKLTWERSYAVAFQVQTSADGHTWKSVYTTTSGQGGTQTVATPKAVGRYLRIYGTKRVTTYGYSLFEIDIR
jgi:hypothetical protein